MAANWIKVEQATPHKPEVLQLARILGVTRDDAFGKSMRFWLWLDSVSVDGRVDGVTSHDVDAIVGAPGISKALRTVGWMFFDDERAEIHVPNFDRHNGESAKARGLKTKRQAKWRASRVDDAASTTASTRLDKRRVLNKQTDNACASCDLLSGTILDSEDFRSAWKLCCAHLGANADRGLNPAWEQATLAELARRGYDKALADVRFTVTIANARNICDSSDQQPKGGRKKAAGDGPEDDWDEFVKKNLSKGKTQ